MSASVTSTTFTPGNVASVAIKNFNYKLSKIQAGWGGPSTATTWGYNTSTDWLSQEEEAWYAQDTRKLFGNKTYLLPDGSQIKIDDKGNYVIEDKDAKVTYLANRIREFSPYLNASDLLAEFVKYTGAMGLNRKEVLSLPIELFIAWLILEAAKKDGDPAPENVITIPNVIQKISKPRCKICGKFIRRKISESFKFCSIQHSQLFLARN